jgi:sec-independent protein translocase protein TatA
MTVGPWQILIVLVIAVVLFGGPRLSRVGRGGGKRLRKTKDSLVDAGRGFKEELLQGEGDEDKVAQPVERRDDSSV